MQLRVLRQQAQTMATPSHARTLSSGGASLSEPASPAQSGGALGPGDAALASPLGRPHPASAPGSTGRSGGGEAMLLSPPTDGLPPRPLSRSHSPAPAAAPVRALPLAHSGSPPFR